MFLHLATLTYITLIFNEIRQTHFKRLERSTFKKRSVTNIAMSLRTPKKFRSSDSRTCRLCGAVGDNRHSKNIFKQQNRELLILARNISGEPLVQSENLPELLCRPCERRLGNFKVFRIKIQESQKKFEQSSKRCIGISPSLERAPKTSRTEPATPRKAIPTRTRLNFYTADEGVSFN